MAAKVLDMSDLLLAGNRYRQMKAIFVLVYLKFV